MFCFDKVDTRQEERVGEECCLMPYQATTTERPCVYREGARVDA